MRRWVFAGWGRVHSAAWCVDGGEYRVVMGSARRVMNGGACKVMEGKPALRGSPVQGWLPLHHRYASRPTKK